MCNGSNHVPLWLNEGLAVYFENIKIRGNGWKWHPPTRRLKILLAYYEKNQRTLRPIAAWLDPNNRRIVVDEYGEAYAMVHFGSLHRRMGENFFAITGAPYNAVRVVPVIIPS